MGCNGGEDGFIIIIISYVFTVPTPYTLYYIRNFIRYTHSCSVLGYVEVQHSAT